MIQHKANHQFQRNFVLLSLIMQQELGAPGCNFLKVVFGKYSVPDEHVVGSVIEELRRIDNKVKKGMERAIDKLCLALPGQSRFADHWYEQTICLTKEHFFATERHSRILALKISITSIVMRFLRGTVTEETASRDVLSWLKTINIEVGGGGLMPCIQSTKPTVAKRTRSIMRRQSSKIIHQMINKDTDIKIYLEFMKLAVASIRVFSNPFEMNKWVVIKIPSRTNTGAPYSITIGSLFMNLASYILEKHLCYENDTQYFVKELASMKELIEFVVTSLGVPNMDGWRSREHDNATILNLLQRKRFIRRSISEEYINKRKRIKISKGDWVEVVECQDAFDSTKSFLVRRDKTETPFPVPPSCFDVVMPTDEQSMEQQPVHDENANEQVKMKTVHSESKPGSHFLVELKFRLQDRV